MKKKTKNTLITILVFVLVFSLALAFFNHLDEDVNNLTFSVEYDGKTYSGEDNEMILPYDGNVEFKVNNASEYSLKVLPNVSFTFRTGSEIKEFSELDFTSAFDITETENGFTINCDKDYSVYSVLQSMYSGSAITLPTLDEDINYFALELKSHFSTIRIAFSQEYFVAVEDLKFDKGGIVF